MNRRGFFKALAATALVAVASRTRLAETALTVPPTDWAEVGQRYVEALARSMLETKETLAANILNKAFNPEAWGTDATRTAITSAADQLAGSWARVHAVHTLLPSGVGSDHDGDGLERGSDPVWDGELFELDTAEDELVQSDRPLFGWVGDQLVAFPRGSDERAAATDQSQAAVCVEPTHRRTLG